MTIYHIYNISIFRSIYLLDLVLRHSNDLPEKNMPS